MGSHVYGIQNFLDDVFTIVGIKKSDKFIKLQVWGKSVLFFIYTTLAPLINFVILIITWSSHEPLTKGEYICPKWANNVGWASSSNERSERNALFKASEASLENRSNQLSSSTAVQQR